MSSLNSKHVFSVLERFISQPCMFYHLPLEKPLVQAYNWNIANDTYVPLPKSKQDAEWELDYLEWLEEYKDYWIYYNFFPYFMTTAGHC